MIIFIGVMVSFALSYYMNARREKRNEAARERREENFIKLMDTSLLLLNRHYFLLLCRQMLLNQSREPIRHPLHFRFSILACIFTKSILL